MNSQCPEQFLPNSGHSWWNGEAKWDDCWGTCWGISYMLICLSFESQGWFITQKAFGSELASFLMNCTWWSLQATTAAGGHSSGGICLVATASQLDRKWSPGLCEFLWSPLPFTQDIRWLLYWSCCNCAVPNLSPYHSWIKAQGWVLPVLDLPDGVLRHLQLWTFENWDFLNLGLSTKLINNILFRKLNLVSKRGLSSY